MTVELLHWPAEDERRDRLRQANRPRLLLVEASADPPLTVDPIEDWVRLPANHCDVQARVESLRHRVVAAPTLADGVLETAAGRVAIPELEARLLAELLERPDRVVDQASLLAAGWPGASPARNLLDVHLHRLRKRIRPLGVGIRTVRKRGYILELGDG